MTDLTKWLSPGGGGGETEGSEKGSGKSSKGKRKTDDTSSGTDFGRSDSFDDFGDSVMPSRKGSDDSDDDDEPKAPVDLDAFIATDEPQQEVVEVEDGEEDGEEGDDEEEGEDEDEYETEEEHPQGYLGPSDELFDEETPSQKELRLQKEFAAEQAKNKKKALINAYLRDMKHLHHLRVKNCLLSAKIQNRTDEHHAIIEKYIQAEKDEVERRKEMERLKNQYREKMCQKKKKTPKEKKPKKEKKRKRHFRFTGENDDHDDTNQVDTAPRAEDVSLKRLEKFNTYDVTPMVGRDTLHDKSAILPEVNKDHVCGSGKGGERTKGSLNLRKSSTGRRFSFQRFQFLNDVAPTKPKRSIDLLNLSLSKLKDKSQVRTSKSSMKKTVSIGAARRKSVQQFSSKRVSYMGLMVGFRKKFEVTREAKRLAKQINKMALDKHQLEHQIMMPDQGVDLKHLNHFKFEFADPRLTARQVSMKLRDELLKLLHQRRISTSRKKWPMRVKGVEFSSKNPYGRVLLQYTRLSHTDQELPYHAYQLLLTNIAFLNSKDKRLTEKHEKNMGILEEERQRLAKGLREILNEIIEGLRIWSSLSGITSLEKRKAREDTEKFIDYLNEVYDKFLVDFLLKLYRSISLTEFALARLHISEGKGEGAELHEFKDIMRCADKLRAEHKNVQKVITEYQHHCKYLIRVVRDTDIKLREVTESVDNMHSDLKSMTRAVTTMIDGMYLCQHMARKTQDSETALKAESGIVSSPLLFDDYQNCIKKAFETRLKKIDVARKVNSKVREIHKIIPIRYGF